MKQRSLRLTHMTACSVYTYDIMCRLRIWHHKLSTRHPQWRRNTTLGPAPPHRTPAPLRPNPAPPRPAHAPHRRNPCPPSPEPLFSTTGVRPPPTAPPTAPLAATPAAPVDPPPAAPVNTPPTAGARARARAVGERATGRRRAGQRTASRCRRTLSRQGKAWQIAPLSPLRHRMPFNSNEGFKIRDDDVAGNGTSGCCSPRHTMPIKLSNEDLKWQAMCVCP